MPAFSLLTYLLVRHEGHATHLGPLVLGSNWAVLRVRSRISDWSTAVLRHTSQRGSPSHSSVNQSQLQVRHNQLNVEERERERKQEKKWKEKVKERVRDRCKASLWETEVNKHKNRKGVIRSRGERGEKERASNRSREHVACRQRSGETESALSPHLHRQQLMNQESERRHV